MRQRWRTPALLAVLVACLFPNSVLAAHPDRAVCVGAGPVLLQVFAAGVFVSRPGIVHAQAPDETAEETTVEDSQTTTPSENTTTPAPLTCDENADVTNSGDTASNSPRRFTHTTLRSARLRGSLLTAARHRLRVPERLHWQRLRLRRLSCGDLQKQDGRRRLLPVRTCRCVHPRARAVPNAQPRPEVELRAFAKVLHLPYISPISPLYLPSSSCAPSPWCAWCRALYLPHVSPISPLYLPYISPISPRCG